MVGKSNHLRPIYLSTSLGYTTDTLTTTKCTQEETQYASKENYATKPYQLQQTSAIYLSSFCRQV